MNFTNAQSPPYTKLLLAGAFLAAAGVAQAVPYHVLFESNVNTGAGVELFLGTYASQADFLAGASSSGAFSQINVSAPYSVHGFTFDGAAYHLLYESDVNTGPGIEVFVGTYATLGDLLNGNASAGVFSQINVSAPYSIAGFTFDGSAYQVLFESNVNTGPGVELFLGTYNTLADVVSGSPAGGTFSQINVSAPYSVHGFTFADGAYQLLFESDVNTGPGIEVFLGSYASIADLLSGSASGGVFSQINVSAPYSVAGFDAFQPQIVPGGDEPTHVSAPQPGWLAGLGLLLLAVRRRIATRAASQER